MSAARELPSGAVRTVRTALLVAALAAAATTADAAAQAAQTPQRVVSAPAAVQTDAPRAGDLIRLRIWREPDYSGEFEVNVEGVAVFPRIGAVHVAAESAASLQQRLTEAYRPFLNHSSIEVTVLRRIQILGAVRKPGLYTLDPTMTLGDAMALAGGTTPEGHPRRIDLVRDGNRVSGQMTLGDRIAESPIRSGDQLFVPERGWFSRNSGLAAAGMTAAASLIIALLVR